MWACKNGHLEVVRFLIENNANINAKSNKGFTPLIHACIKGHLEIAKLLIDNHADINIKDSFLFTALVWAYRNRHFEIAKLLIDAGADVNVKYDDRSILMNACREKFFDFAKLLAENGANVNVRDNSRKKTALMYICEESYDKDVFDTIKVLIDKGANVYAKDEDGNTALEHCSSSLVKKIKDYLKTKKTLNPSKPLKLKLPEDIVCFDEIGHCDILVKDFIKSTDNILIKIGNNIKGYNRTDIVTYYNNNKTLYSKEKLFTDEFKKLNDAKNMFFSTVDTGNNTFVLIPQTREKFFS